MGKLAVGKAPHLVWQAMNLRQFDGIRLDRLETVVPSARRTLHGFTDAPGNRILLGEPASRTRQFQLAFRRALHCNDKGGRTTVDHQVEEIHSRTPEDVHASTGTQEVRFRRAFRQETSCQAIGLIGKQTRHNTVNWGTLHESNPDPGNGRRCRFQR